MQKQKSAVPIIFAAGWITYLTAYLCRVNFSSAMNTITLEKGFDAGLLGIIGAVYYGMYAFGQLVNGYIGDRVRANRFMLLALFGTMICNLIMSFSSSFALMLVIWGINGCFQSMFWSTIIRVLAQNISADKRAGVSAGISIAMPIAYMVSWGVLGKCLEGADAMWYFFVPALICLPVIGIWLYLSKKLSFEIPGKGENKHTIKETLEFIGKERLVLIVIVCMLHGLIKEGAAYWTPLLISGMDVSKTLSPYVLVSILPSANLVGILLSRSLLKNIKKDPYVILVMLFISIGCVSVGLSVSSAGLVVIGMMALISGLCYANNTILMSFIPMQYTEKNMVASIIGVFDFASYVGAAVSTYVLGRVLSSVGFAPLPFIWMFASAAACAIGYTAYKMRKKDASQVHA
ncbi:MAG: MFS transporter [Clostridiales bacterium]|nr:MFS transporter [Clostridiales bacterium]